MSKILEEYGEKMYQEGFEEGLHKVDIEIATRMLADGKLSLEKISKYTGLEIAEVEELAAKARRHDHTIV